MTIVTTNDAPLRASSGDGGAVGRRRAPASRRIDRARLRDRRTIAALVAATVAAVGQALGTVFIGRVAEDPTRRLVVLLAVCVLGSAVADTIGRVAWNTVIDRAEGRLRADLLDAVMAQPLPTLTEQAVGEILDRIDDDTHELGTLLRMSAWRVIRLGLAVVPLLIVAGLTWWPAWLLFPAVGAAVFTAVRPRLIRLAELKVIEEAAWTDHAAAMEEGIAARDDVRTSLAQSYLVRRCAELAAVIHEKMADVVAVEAAIMRRSGLLLNGLLAVVAIVGVLLVADGDTSTATLVTLFAVTVAFVGQVDQVAHHLPDLQAGVGAMIRLRGLMASPAEPSGGVSVPDGPATIEFRDVHFAYDEGSFALSGVDLTVEAGTTCALVGRSGSGKSTLASLLSRAVDPEPGTVFLGGTDVLDIELDALRSAIGLVTQRTEVIAGTLAENIALFADVDRSRLERAVSELGLDRWVDGLPDGLDTVLGPAGTTLSAGEEQLVAFARLLVREVRVVVLDEATARMDPVTEHQVVDASRRLLEGRTGIVVAHRLGTTERADTVAVLDGGGVVQHGPRARLAVDPGAFRTLLEDAASATPQTVGPARVSATVSSVGRIGQTRRTGERPPEPDVADTLGFGSGIRRAILTRPEWGLLAVALFTVFTLLGSYGAITGWLWGRIVEDLDQGGRPTDLLTVMVIGLLVASFALAEAVRRFPHWWISVMLRVRTSVLVGQTSQRRLHPTPPGEVVARAMDCDRYARYADRWYDFVVGLLIAALAAVFGGTVLAGLVLLAVMGLTAVTSAFGSPIAGRSAAASSTARAEFGRALVSSLDAIRTVKLSASTSAIHRHLNRVDAGRVDAAVREHRIQSLLDGVPVLMVQAGVVAAWAIHLVGGWGLATALLVSGTVAGFEWFGRVAGSVITEAPGTRAWQRETGRLAGGVDLMDLPAGVDLVDGIGMAPTPAVTDRLERLELRDLAAVHPDGTIGAAGVDLDIERGELVLVLGRIGSGKSSILDALAGLVHSTGSMKWNGREIDDRELFLRPGRVAHVAQVPRVLSGTFTDNIRLDHARPVDGPIEQARLARDVDDAGGSDSMVGQRGVRLSGGQIQRLALARALATGSELLVADDVSSALDASTEIELWDALRRDGRTVVGSSNKRAALARADRVVVLIDGRIADVGSWARLEHTWDHLAG